MDGHEELEDFLSKAALRGDWLLIGPDGKIYQGSVVDLMRILAPYHPYLFPDALKEQPK